MSGLKLGPNQKELFDKTRDNADDVLESSSKKWMTSAEKTQLSTNTSDILNIKTNFFDKTTDTGNDIYQSVGLGTIQYYLDTISSRGWVDGCSYTDNLDGTGTYESGTARLKTLPDHGSTGGLFNVTGATITFSDGNKNFVYIDYNSGSAIVKSTTSLGTIITGEDTILIDIVYRRGTTLYPIQWTNKDICIDTLLDEKAIDEAEGKGLQYLQHAKGCIAAEVGTRNISISVGTFYFHTRKKTSPVFNTSSGHNFTLWYGTTSNGFTETISQTTIGNTQYYNSGTDTLTSLGTDYYTNCILYMDLSCTTIHVFLIADSNHLDNEDASAEGIPSDIPDFLADFCFPIAKIKIS